MALRAFVMSKSVVWLIGILSLVATANAQLQVGFYNQFPGCGTVETRVYNSVRTFTKQDRGIAAGLLRLHFHDCFVLGCDASILILSTPGNVAEVDGPPNLNSIRGFNVIAAAKAAVEAVCPGKVSCADLIALAARDSVQQISGEYWSVPTGRRDGSVSLASNTINGNIPAPTENYDQLVQSFANKGFTQQEMVVLSGAHTIGFTHCRVISPRLYNSTAVGAVDGTDPTLNPTYAAQLKVTCPFGGPNTQIAMDPTLGNNTFDVNYYKNVKKNKGLFNSDAALNTNSTGSAVVNVEAASVYNFPFFTSFALAMVKMGKISVLTGTNGEIRANCSVINP